MSRRSTPERLDAARRAATVRRLELEGELPEQAEALVAAWEAVSDAEAIQRDGAYWDAGWAWIDAQRRSQGPVIAIAAGDSHPYDAS
jgi:hypothetical protein